VNTHSAVTIWYLMQCFRAVPIPDPLCDVSATVGGIGAVGRRCAGSVPQGNVKRNALDSVVQWLGRVLVMPELPGLCPCRLGVPAGHGLLKGVPGCRSAGGIAGEDIGPDKMCGAARDVAVEGGEPDRFGNSGLAVAIPPGNGGGQVQQLVDQQGHGVVCLVAGLTG
jgi:hypothetical protein